MGCSIVLVLLLCQLHSLSADEAVLYSTAWTGTWQPQLQTFNQQPARSPAQTQGWRAFEDSQSGRVYKVCDSASWNEDQPVNWIRTPFIATREAAMVEIKILFSQVQCSDLTSKDCLNSLKVHVLEARNSFDSKKDELSLYQQKDEITADLFLTNLEDSDFFKTKIYVQKLALSKGTEGIFIALSDSGSCSKLLSLDVTSFFCPETISNLDSFPRTSSGVDGLVNVYGSCVSSASSSSRPVASCRTEGSWLFHQSSGVCQCDAGYAPNDTFTGCSACPIGFFKDSAANTECEACPAGSESHHTASATCGCRDGLHRGLNDSARSPCEPAPGKPRFLRAEVRNTAVTVSWQPPPLPASYTRDNLCYRLSCSKCPPDSMAAVPRCIHSHSFIISNLDAETEYEFGVATINSINVHSPELASPMRIIARTGRIPQVSELEALTLGHSSVRLTWRCDPSGPMAQFEVIAVQNNVHSRRLTTPHCYQHINGLSQGIWEFKVCIEGVSGSCSLTVSADFPGSSGQRLPISPRNIVIVAGMILGIVILILVVLIMSVWCVRSGGGRPGKWTGSAVAMAAAAYPSPGSQYNSGKSMLVGQGFVEPGYYDDPRTMLAEFTREIQLQHIEFIHNDQPEKLLLFKKGPNGMPEVSRALIHGGFNQSCLSLVKKAVISSSQELRQFALEAALIGQFNHPNVLLLHGVAYSGAELYLCMEYTAKGTLDGVVRDSPLSPLQLTHLLRGVVAGMHFLSETGYTHKVLTAENVLVTEANCCKVAGFDTRAALETEEMENAQPPMLFSALVPWLAPEIACCSSGYRKYSSASDVWSFGVVVWETLSGGERPYWDWNPQHIARSVEEGFRLPAPANSPSPLVELMGQCWEADRAHRPTFAALKMLLEQLICQPNLLDHHSNKWVPSTPSSKKHPSPPMKVDYQQQPMSVEEWLAGLNLGQYASILTTSNYLTVSDLAALDSATLEHLGVNPKHSHLILNSLESVSSPPSSKGSHTFSIHHNSNLAHSII